ncbi:MAG TPA: hypothetical protein VKB52_11085 [Rhodanobacteraceae bacterium]|nr:hypothetical protein [Rhodanobacteraceae bacterium]
MKSAFRLLVLLASFVAMLASASAATVGGPTMGLWYNPDQSGRGYDIDLQGDTMIVTTYVYEQSGDPIWYLSSGTFNHDTGVFESTYDSYANGQCFGCPYHAPTVTSGAAGPITITFHTNQTATLTYPGGTTDIVKYAYGFPTRTDVLYGEWALSYENAGTVAGDWVVLDTPHTDPASGAIFASGHAAGAPTTTVLAIYDPTYREAQIQVTQGTTQRLYRFGVFDDRRGIGIVMITAQGQAQTQYTATGARLLYKSEIAGGIIGQTDEAAKSAPDTAAIQAKFARAFESLQAAQR